VWVREELTFDPTEPGAGGCFFERG
jgi:hypothetical protein